MSIYLNSMGELKYEKCKWSKHNAKNCIFE